MAAEFYEANNASFRKWEEQLAATALGPTALDSRALIERRLETLDEIYAEALYEDTQRLKEISDGHELLTNISFYCRPLSDGKQQVCTQPYWTRSKAGNLPYLRVTVNDCNNAPHDTIAICCTDYIVDFEAGTIAQRTKNMIVKDSDMQVPIGCPPVIWGYVDGSTQLFAGRHYRPTVPHSVHIGVTPIDDLITQRGYAVRLGSILESATTLGADETRPLGGER